MTEVVKMVKVPIDADVYDRLESLAKKQYMTLQELIDTEIVKDLRKIIEA